MDSILTRRGLLQLGAAAWLGTFFGGASLARAVGLDFTAPAYLRRAAWTPLAGTAVTAAGASLQLAEVGDLPHLAGRDDAFRLELTGAPDALAAGTHAFRHPALGAFSLFVAPVDVVAGGVQRYEVVIDRSVGVPRSVPQAPVASPAPAVASPTPAAAPAAKPHRRRRRRLVHRSVRRLHHRRPLVGRRVRRQAWAKLVP